MKLWITTRFGSWVGLSVGCVLLALLVSCLPTFDQLNYTRKEPIKNDLIGTWVPDTPTLKLLRTRGGYDASIQPKLILRDDGTFNLSRMPDWWSDSFGESHKGVEDFSGTWGTSAYADTGVWLLDLRARSGTRAANLIGQRAPYRLAFIIGDPDNDISMTFEKQ